MSIFIKLLRFVKPFQGRALLAAILGFCTIAANVGLMGTSGYLIAKAALRPETVLLLWIPIVGVRFFGLSRGVFRYMERLVSHDVTFRVLAKLRVFMYAKLEPKAVPLLENKRSSDVLAAVIGDVEQLQYFYLRVLAPPIIALFTTILGFIVLWQYGLFLGLLLLSMMVCGGIAIPWISYWLTKKHGEQETKLKANLYVNTEDLCRGIQEWTTNGRLDEAVDRITHTQDQLDAVRKKSNWIMAITAGGMLGVVNVTMWFILTYSIFLVAGHRMEGWAIPVTVLVTLACFEAITPLPLAFQQMGQTTIAAKRFFETADQVDLESRLEPQSSQGLTPMDSSIAIHQVSVRYPGTTSYALHDISLRIKSGEHVAIIGESGAGKSTLFQVLAALRPYQLGSIQLGGVELEQLTEEQIRDFISVVPQNPYFFHASIEENLRFAKPDATNEQLAQALELAQLSTLVLQLPKGMKTLVGEWGMRFSGGERQRFALARAILRDTPIVLMDEPTTGLDAATEKAFLQAMETTLKQKTVLWITHDMSHLSQMDKVITLEKGKIKEK
jgi:thiol reductant ABC exporter CydC subunit